MTNENSLKSILTNYTAAQKVLNTDLSTIPAATQAAFQMQINVAAKNLKDLRSRYTLTLFNNAVVAVYLNGDSASLTEVKSIVEAEGGGVQFIDMLEPWRNLAKPVFDGLRGSQFKTVQWSNIWQEIHKAIERDPYTSFIPYHTPPQLMKTWPDAESLAVAMKEYVDGYSWEYSKHSFVQSIVNKALSIDFTGSTYGVIITNHTAKDKENLDRIIIKGTASQTLTSEHTISKQLVEALFKRAKTPIVSKKQTTKEQ